MDHRCPLCSALLMKYFIGLSVIPLRKHHPQFGLPQILVFLIEMQICLSMFSPNQVESDHWEYFWLPYYNSAIFTPYFAVKLVIIKLFSLLCHYHVHCGIIVYPWLHITLLINVKESIVSRVDLTSGLCEELMILVFHKVFNFILEGRNS